LVVKTGHLTVDLAMPTYYPNVQHGWVGPYLTGVTGYDNGDSTFVQLSVPFWSMLDPSVPELPIGNGGGPVIRTMVEVGNTTIFGSNTTPINYGETFAEYGLEANEFIPLAPISAPWTLTAFSDGYGSADLPEAVLETRLDLDLHNNVPGTVILSARGLSHLNRPVVFDPTLFAASTAPVGTVAGKHKVALFREQTDGPETVMALLVIDVAVGDGTVVTPPSLCTDPAATNQGQPLPCVFPPPPVLTVFTFTCDAAGKCTVVIR
jgi:hypothetical protein